MATASVPKIGEVLLGKYRVDRVLGTGGMGKVLAATHIELDQQVAIKVLLPECAELEGMTRRFLREARAAVCIKSDHVCKVLDVGNTPDGLPLIVMEYLAGENLAAHVTRGGPLDVETAVGYVLEACEAVAEAHANGIIHRDLKPENLFLAERPDGFSVVKVLDFGISKTEWISPDGGKTSPGVSMGSPPYMAPEQVRSPADVDVRTDVYGVGATLHELLSGAPPFNGESPMQIIARVLEDQPPPLRSLVPDIPPGLEAIVLRCLAKTQAARYDSLGPLVTELFVYAAPEMEQSVDRVARVLGQPSRARLTSGRVFSSRSAPRVEVAAATVALEARAAGASQSEGGMVRTGGPITASGTVASPTGSLTRKRPSAVVWAVPVAIAATAAVFVGRSSLEHHEPTAAAASTVSSDAVTAKAAAVAREPARAVADTSAAPAVSVAPVVTPVADAGADAAKPASTAAAQPGAQKSGARPATKATGAPDAWNREQFGGRR